MKIILAPDSFKGSLTSLEVISIVEKAAVKHFDDLEIVRVPIADGGEGTVEALVATAKGVYREIEVSDPLGRRISAKYGIINESTAVIEMAQASGLTLIGKDERNPLITTTYGTGEIIKRVMDEGIRDILIGIGGSATNDGGIGAAQALGIHFLNESGIEVGFGGGELKNIAHIDIKDLDKRITECRITVICDVNNPLTGERGATAVFGPQKGATEAMLYELEMGMKNYVTIMKKDMGIDVEMIPGAGAAGGLGAALIAFFNAKLRPGVDTILDFVHFDELLNETDLVVTGEGRVDSQSAYGKVPVGIARRCKKHGVPVVVIAGGIGDDISSIYENGIASIITAINKDMSLDEALIRAEELLIDASDRMFRLIKTGMYINKNQSGN